MEYRIRVKKGKEKAFRELIQALRSLGVLEEVEVLDKNQLEKAKQEGSSSAELASQYRDLVD